MSRVKNAQGKDILVSKKGFFKTLFSQWQLMVMSVPMLLYVLLFNYGPMWGWVTAFQDYKPKLGIFGSKFVGMKNFEWLFSRQDFINSIRNTLGMSVINLVFGTVSSILLAILLNEVRHRGFKRTVQTVTYLPHFLSMVIVVGMAQNIFASNGAVNALLMTLGLVKEPVFFLGEGKYFWWLVGVINVWKEVGWNTIIYISAMTAIDPCLYEAASIDGAGRFHKIMNVTLPGIRSTFVILLIMNIGHLMEAGFEIQYLLGSSVVMDWSQTIDVFVLQYGISKQQYGVATAAGMFKSVVAIILLVSANAISRRLGEDTLI
ncbi:MAG: ABC transporter permease subunit [Clostridiales bacterium]|nr:sugar ABC transporter permease [Clostridia bacterium]MCR4885253.1 ABC transporter permease subunit [Clostridiales bacterium]